MTGSSFPPTETRRETQDDGKKKIGFLDLYSNSYLNSSSLTKLQLFRAALWYFIKCRSGCKKDQFHFFIFIWKIEVSVRKKQATVNFLSWKIHFLRAISYYNTALEIEIWYFFCTMKYARLKLKV